MKRDTRGLRDRILRAGSVTAVRELEAEGRLFEHATPKTRAKWVRAIEWRLAELHGEVKP